MRVDNMIWVVQTVTRLGCERNGNHARLTAVFRDVLDDGMVIMRQATAVADTDGGGRACCPALTFGEPRHADVERR